MKAYDATNHHLCLYEAGVHKCREGQDDLSCRGPSFDPADRFCCFECPTSHEDAKRTKTALLVLCKQLIAPGNGTLHRLLAFWQVSGSPAQERQTMAKLLAQLG